MVYYVNVLKFGLSFSLGANFPAFLLRQEPLDLVCHVGY